MLAASSLAGCAATTTTRSRTQQPDRAAAGRRRRSSSRATPTPTRPAAPASSSPSSERARPSPGSPSATRRTAPCDTLEAALAPDRARAWSRRGRADTNGDGRLTAADGESLVFVDLARGTEGRRWCPATRTSRASTGRPAATRRLQRARRGRPRGPVRDGPERPEQPEPDPHRRRSRERRPRIDPTGTVAVYERIEATGKGASSCSSSPGQHAVTPGGDGGRGALTGTPYMVGLDADPDYSPDGRRRVPAAHRDRQRRPRALGHDDRRAPTAPGSRRRGRRAALPRRARLGRRGHRVRGDRRGPGRAARRRRARRHAAGDAGHGCGRGRPRSSPAGCPERGDLRRSGAPSPRRSNMPSR